MNCQLVLTKIFAGFTYNLLTKCYYAKNYSSIITSALCLSDGRIKHPLLLKFSSFFMDVLYVAYWKKTTAMDHQSHVLLWCGWCFQSKKTFMLFKHSCSSKQSLSEMYCIWTAKTENCPITFEEHFVANVYVYAVYFKILWNEIFANIRSKYETQLSAEI